MRSKLTRSVAAIIVALLLSVVVLAVERPVVVSAPRPAYPPIAVAKRISGTVLVDVDISLDGKVIGARAITGHNLLRKDAREAALQWRFNTNEGGSIRSVRLTFIFHAVSYVSPEKTPEFTSPYQVEIEWAGES